MWKCLTFPHNNNNNNNNNNKQLLCLTSIISHFDTYDCTCNGDEPPKDNYGSMTNT